MAPDAVADVTPEAPPDRADPDATEATLDAALDATSDAPPDTPPDAAPDTPLDALDGTRDAAVDAAVEAGPDGPPRPLGPGWARALGAARGSVALAVVTDPLGNVYVGGRYEGTMTLGAVTLPAPTSTYGTFLVSFTAAGDLRWARALGSTGWFPGLGLAADPTGRVMYAGHAHGGADFGCGPTGGSSGSEGVVLVSLNPDGSCRWARRYEGAGRAHAYGVAADGAGNSYVVGHLGGATSLGGELLRGVGSTFAFVASYTAEGAYRWSRSYSGSFSSEGVAVASQPSGDLVALVNAQRALDLGATRLTADGELLGVVALDRDGGHRWSVAAGTDTFGVARGGAVAADGEGGWLFVGRSSGTLRLGALTLRSLSGTRAFVAQLGGDGAPRFGLDLRGLGPSEGLGAAAAGGRRVAGGTSEGAGTTLGAASIPARGGRDGWWASLSAAGEVLRARSLGGRGEERLEALALGPDGALYAVGSFSGVTDVGQALRASGDRAAYLVRILPDAAPPVCSGAERLCAERCVDVATEDTHCGACGATCGALERCRAGRCEFHCPDSLTGCFVRLERVCVDLATDPSNCGACDERCPTEARCVAGRCTCPAGQTLCAARCVDLMTTASDCGACGVVCAPPGARPRCAAGACAVAACDPGRGDCNGRVDDGCEVDVATSVAHCGACGRACAAGQRCVAGRCCVGLGCDPYPSSGREGAFAPTADTVLPAGVHEFTTVTIPPGVTVRTHGDGVLELRATGAVSISGVVDLTGGDGQSAGCRSAAPPSEPYTCPGGAAGAAGHRGVVTTGGVGGGFSVSGIDLEFRFFHGGVGGAGLSGGGGGVARRDCLSASSEGGSAGGAGGTCRALSVMEAACTPARGGPASVALYAGRDGSTPTTASCGPAFGWSAGGGAGGSIGTAAAEDLAVTRTFGAGSGGGGGGCVGFSSMGFEYVMGGGGGGGGGALRVSSPVRITLGPAARLLVDGGRGGAPNGGGGSGGVVVLASPVLQIPAGAAVSARGGAAGTLGGAGGPGRLRLSVTPAGCSLGGTFDPPLVSGCAPTSPGVAGRAFVGTWPD